MAKEFTSGMLWNKASVDGLILGAATIGFALLSSLSSHLGAFAGGLAGFILLFGKIAACIYLVRFFIARIHREFGADAKTLYGYGLRVALCSSLIVSAYSLVAALQINPETYMEQFSQAMASTPVALDSNSLTAIEAMLPKLPAITFFTSLVYCFLWGMVLSAIFSRSAASANPFDGDMPKSDGTIDNQ